MTMSTELEDKIQELESNSKKRNYTTLVVILIILGIFAALYFYTESLAKEKIKDNKNAIVEKEKEAEIKQAKEQKDSIIQFTSQVYVTELEDIKQKILTGSSSKDDIIRSIDSIQKIAVKVSKLSSDTIPVRYYRRPNDNSTAIINTIRETKSPIYYFDSIYDVKDENRVNTVYYGNLVRRAYVDTLVAKLRRLNVPIERVKQFKGKRGYDWKKVTVQLEYEIDSTTLEIDANDKWNIRFYSYKPDQKAKSNARTALTKEGYHVEFFPDWERKMSFFSEYPVVLYYDVNNKAKAQKIAESLKRATNINFAIETGDGLGVSKAEKSNLFIVHYNGS